MLRLRHALTIAGAVLPFLAFPRAEAQDEGAGQEETAKILEEARRTLVEELRQQGIRLDLEHKAITFDAQICVDRGPIEYLLVGPHGATHESLLITGIQPSTLNAGIRALGVKPGENIRYVKKDPPPSEEELRAGELLYHIYPPEGDELDIVLTWSADAKQHTYRAEECILNAETRRTMPETGWVYLGSRFVEIEPGAGEVFIADVERNIFSIYQFEVRNSILVNPLRDASYDDIWFANPRILPEKGTDVVVRLTVRPPDAKEEKEPDSEDDRDGDGQQDG